MIPWIELTESVKLNEGYANASDVENIARNDITLFILHTFRAEKNALTKSILKSCVALATNRIIYF